MPAFTLELWRVLEYTDGDIGLDDYPIFSESYRNTLNTKIINHYYNQEIGLETIPLFRLAIRRRMHEIMPYYNQLYESERLEINPINTVDLSTESGGEIDSTGRGESTTVSDTESKSRSVQSDFPQHQLADNNDYASAAADSASDSNVSGTAEETSESKTTNQSYSRTKGVQGSQADMLMRFRESFLNIDVMIIAELQDCFMSIWNTNDSYTERFIY